MHKGCFGSLLTASESSAVCSVCVDKHVCHQRAKETAVKLHGEFDGFPIDNIAKRKKRIKGKTHAGSDS